VLNFRTQFVVRAKGRRFVAVTAALAAAGMTLSLASVAVAGGPARAAVAGASFGRAFKLNIPLNSASTPDADAGALSCPSVGNCVAGGGFNDKRGNFQPMVIMENSGKWSRGVELKLPNDAPASVFASVAGVSCTRIGDCVAIGSYPVPTANFGRAFVATEVAGRWHQAAELKLPSGAASPPQAKLSAVSCWALGWCMATGNYLDSTQNVQAMMLTETNGRWHRATEIFPPSDAGPKPFLIFGAIACQHGGQCVIAGEYLNPVGHAIGLGLVVSHGNFLTVENIKLPHNADDLVVDFNSASCPSSTQCVIVGEYRDTGGNYQPFSAVESNDGFKSATQITAVPPNEVRGALYSVSCTVSGRCVAVGRYTDSTGHDKTYVVTRSTTGHWGNAAIVRTPPGASTAAGKTAILGGVSCLSHGCVTVGEYETDADAFIPMAAIEP
jgi:hypothetical protein